MDKTPVCLDTSVLIDYYRKKNKSKTLFVQLTENYIFAISVITKFEILTGITDNQRDFWTQLFSHFEIIHLGEKEVEIAANIVRDLRKRNQIIGVKDIFIASTAIANNLPIATLNLKDFKRVENLKIIQ